MDTEARLPTHVTVRASDDLLEQLEFIRQFLSSRGPVTVPLDRTAAVYAAVRIAADFLRGSHEYQEQKRAELGEWARRELSAREPKRANGSGLTVIERQHSGSPGNGNADSPG